MHLLRVRSFQGRIFLAILVVVLLPAGVAVAGGALTLKSIGTTTGTLGAWDAVAQSGRRLLDAIDSSGVADPTISAAADAHRQALSESVRFSRFYAFFVDRAVAALPLAALIVGLVVAALAFLTARRLARGFGRPVAELAGWTERIAREEPLPPEADDPADVEELRVLRSALRRMAGEIEDGRRRAVENARMRSWTNLARRVAHEIKNPLTPMRMAATTLAKGRDGPAAEAARVLVEEIERLDEMARTFSQYGKMPEGPRSLVDLGELLAGLATQHATASISVEVHAEGAVLVEAHYDALERAFRNLVMNAVEAQEGCPSGRVDVHVEKDETSAVVRVEDRGPGVPTELLDDIWNPDVTTKRRGTGLGLALVRQTMRHHEGEVAVANRPEGGAVFTVRLPLGPPEPPGTPTPPLA
ncbi:MAG: HAMP domain-containing histidine kinase [Gemmatimonadetes bacterium]|nr:HAMP domain-containing histidine kinase [Gemmatimonadota bacterium]